MQVALLPENDRQVDPEGLVEHDYRGALVGTQHAALEAVIDSMRESHPTADEFTRHYRPRMPAQVEA